MTIHPRYIKNDCTFWIITIFRHHTRIRPAKGLLHISLFLKSYQYFKQKNKQIWQPGQHKHLTQTGKGLATKWKTLIFSLVFCPLIYCKHLAHYYLDRVFPPLHAPIARIQVSHYAVNLRTITHPLLVHTERRSRSARVLANQQWKYKGWVTQNKLIKTCTPYPAYFRILTEINYLGGLSWLLLLWVCKCYF